MTAAVADLPHVVRPMAPCDRAFVWETTLKVRQPFESKDGKKHPTVSWADWVKLHGTEVDYLLAVSRVLVLDGGGDMLLGFLVVRESVVEMLYVKSAYRGLGLGMELMRADASLKWSPVLQARRPNKCWHRWMAAKDIAWVGVK